MKYILHNHVSGQEYSEHPNLEGAKLSALRHVKNGDKIIWTDADKISFGYVNGYCVAKFGIEKDD